MIVRWPGEIAAGAVGDPKVAIDRMNINRMKTLLEPQLAQLT
ncbi:hypothetical protein TBK1r_41230 [Stieleria magnilauensis]|uniref:Uncharacterized protein n=1 Tax=Stieleria magnilauensis TaxID=2527963 RepID=A0ABX5XT35_9BACT|nr:hypothetical protein TBK1r_41230 [Planctomycetes bacterium TBK1r]